MSNLEIGGIRFHIPDKDGVHSTPVGDIKVEILQWGSMGAPKQIRLESDALRGSPLRNRWRRKAVRTICLNSRGAGTQNISKREVIIVRPDVEEWEKKAPVKILDSRNAPTAQIKRDHDWY